MWGASEKVGGRVPCVPHLIAPMVVLGYYSLGVMTKNIVSINSDTALSAKTHGRSQFNVKLFNLKSFCHY